MKVAMEKAQLLAFHTEAGEEVKLWLSKSRALLIADSDEPEKMICPILAWHSYKTGLKNHFPVERWSRAVI